MLNILKQHFTASVYYATIMLLQTDIFNTGIILIRITSGLDISLLNIHKVNI